MALSWKSLIFTLAFFQLFFLLILFGESFLNWYVMGGISIIMMGYSRHLNWSQLSHYKGILLLWSLFLCVLIGSSVFTHSWPLTISALVSYFFAFSFFWFWMLLDRTILPSGWLQWGIIGMMVELSVLSFIFFMRADWGQLLPGMNVLHHTFGHNHIAALLIIILPLSWWLSDQKWPVGQLGQVLVKVMPLFLTAALLISFGRVAIVIGLAQLLFTLFAKYRTLNPFRFHNRAKMVSALFVVILGVKLFFSLITYWQPNFSCPIPSLESQLCKSLSVEARPWYWRQALAAIKEFTLMGYGPGTFSLISQRYLILPYHQTGYAHNAFLQVMSEIGIAGGVLFIGLWLLILNKVYVRVKEVEVKQKQRYSIELVVFIGIVSSAINALFDFDWSFTGTFCLTLLMVGMVFRDGKKHSNLNVLIERAGKLTWWIVTVSVGVIIGLYVVVDGLLMNKQVIRAVELFPYFSQHKLIFFNSDQLSASQYQHFSSIYQYHPEINQTSFAIDPWRQVTQFEYDREISESNFIEADYEIQQLVLFITAKRKYGYEIEYSQKVQLAQQLLAIGDEYFKQQNYGMAGVKYHQAQALEAWTLDKHQPVFVGTQNNDELKEFLSELGSVDPQYFGNYQFEYIRVYQELANQAILIQDWAQAEHYLQLMWPADYWTKVQLGNYYVWRTLDDQAISSFQTCLDNFPILHDDCYYGQLSIKEGWANRDRYWEVSDIISGKKQP